MNANRRLRGRPVNARTPERRLHGLQEPTGAKEVQRQAGRTPRSGQLLYTRSDQLAFADFGCIRNPLCEHALQIKAVILLDVAHYC
jgi:hypothetical protein